MDGHTCKDAAEGQKQFSPLLTTGLDVTQGNHDPMHELGNLKQHLEVTAPQQCLASVSRLLLRPDSTLPVGSIFRPLLLRVVAKLVQDAAAPGQEEQAGAIRAGPSVEMAVALVALLGLAPHLEGLVIQYFQFAPAPFDYISSPQLPGQAAAAPAAAGIAALQPVSPSLGRPSDAQLAQATLQGLELSAQLRRLWRWSALLGLLRHADPDVRYCAVQCMAFALGLGDAKTAELAQRVLTQQDEFDCSQRWQAKQALCAAYRAAALLPLPDSGDGTADEGGRLGMAKGRDSSLGGSQDSTGSRKRKYGDVYVSAAPAGSLTGSSNSLLGPIPGYVNVGGLELPVRQSTAGTAGTAAPMGGHPLVHTSSVERNLQAVALGLCMGSPVLLEGPPGSGKSALVEHVAGLTGNAEGMVRLHLDDQMDSKTLVGAYITTARPGEFTWQPGPLAQAVSQGRWVLVEDINLAPAEVLAALVPLLERRTLHVAARGEVVTAAPGFQLLATVTSAPGGTASGAYGSSQAVKDLLGGLFHYVLVEPPSGREQQAILGRRFPALAPLLPHAMATLALFQAAYGQRSSAAHSSRHSSRPRPQQHEDTDGGDDSDAAEEAVAAALEAGGVRPGELGFAVGRHFSLRDLGKWCSRIHTVHSTLLSRSLKASLEADYQASVAAVPLAVREAAFLEAADCFCALLGRAEVADRLLKALCTLWAVPSETLAQYTSLHKPAVELGAANIVIGRATLPLLDAGVAVGARQALQAAAAAPRGGSGPSRFAATGHALRNMERVAVAAGQTEPVLLVGETGTGKTTLVQQIAKQVGAKLVVLNLSQQTDSSDLLGGFRPVQPADAVLPLLDTFADLVRRTWPRGKNDKLLASVARYGEKRKWGQLVAVFRSAVDKIDKESHMEPPKRKNKRAKQGIERVKDPAAAGSASAPISLAKALSAALREEWLRFGTDLTAAEAAAAAAEGGFAFAFVEGVLVRAVREGWWLLLDEVNLAPPEALERIAGLLEGAQGSLVVTERGDASSIPRHPNFRLFAAMNPATDAGKRDLPAPLRNRFTELWIGEPPARADLAAIVAGYLAGVAAGLPVDAVVDFYLAAKAEADMNLQDGAGHKPAYNLRTLCRALEYAAAATPTYGLQRALYDGFAMSFLTQLDPGCAPRLEKLMHHHLVGPGVTLKALMRAPPAPPGPSHVLFDHFWVETGPAPLPDSKESDGKGGSFVLTPAVTHHLRNLARAVLLRRYPILLQGPTSSGKTSLVAYLAAQTGHAFVRINNHEQTDLQEYLGSYVSDESGRLVFREGLLVQAVRQGHWIVLDELNLAPTEVLEALNRLLDDNRELYVPELQETVKPHPHFMLFATQNPPGIYAGRKTLSRAFRSRFLELHVDDIPDTELITILEKRCAIAPSYASKLVAVMRELQRRRASSNVFAGRHGFITPRDLFRWAGRGAVGYQQLCEDGYAVLGERLRSAEERQTVQEVLEKALRVKLDMDAVYGRDGGAPLRQLHAALAAAEAQAHASAGADQAQQAVPSGDARQGAAVGSAEVQTADGASKGGSSGGGGGSSVADVAALQSALGGVVWTKSMSRMYSLLERCLAHSEPALLVGETGTGKTTVCQMAAFVRGRRLHIINCNQHTEVSDFLGGFRPNRHRERSLLQLQSSLAALNASPLLPALGQAPLPPPAAPSPAALQALLTSARALLAAATKHFQQQQLEQHQGGPGVDGAAQQQHLPALREAVEQLGAAVAGVRAPFEWVDGPLVEAMKRGDIILVDELNLAEDAVLERLNSVLEPGRTLTLAERGGAGAEVIAAHPAFRLVATMNPGGDYGKKELSPALANRFTSIWVPAIEDLGELRAILESRLPEGAVRDLVVPRLLDFWSFFRSKAAHAARQALSVRDLLAWAHFITTTAPAVGALPAYAHGAHLVLLDGIGLGVGLSAEASQQLRDMCHDFLLGQLPHDARVVAEAAAGRAQPPAPAVGASCGADGAGSAAHLLPMEVDAAQGEEPSQGSATWGIAPFFVQRRSGTGARGGARFDFGAPTTGRNALRVLRALQLRKPVLLEGSPGVGKTSLIAAMAKAVGQHLVRINLSEQTDMMDLLGADLPVEGGAPGEFAWSDGPLLAAIKSGAWVLLDELNLANQTVLEGLNAVLDHRAEVFIPELGRTFRCPRSFRVFAAQNPLQEGGGRKGLPKSFLNRFMRVHVELLQQEDLRFIAGALHPRMPPPTLDRMVAFLQRLHHDANVAITFAAAGGPWEFNLRDLLRWCELAEAAAPAASAAGAEKSRWALDAETGPRPP
ncbi:hypothetical protein N2152v2_001252 [Parachlorella kessleri]